METELFDEFATNIYNEYESSVQDLLYDQSPEEIKDSSELVDKLLAEKRINLDTVNGSKLQFTNIKINIKNVYENYDGSTYSFEWKWVVSNNVETIRNTIKTTDWYSIFSGHPDIHHFLWHSILPFKNFPEVNLLDSYCCIEPTKKKEYPIRMVKSYNL